MTQYGADINTIEKGHTLTLALTYTLTLTLT